MGPAAVPWASSTMRRAKTSVSSKELLASRFAPCAPVHAVSPAASRPGTLVRPSGVTRRPPIM